MLLIQPLNITMILLEPLIKYMMHKSSIKYAVPHLNSRFLFLNPHIYRDPPKARFISFLLVVAMGGYDGILTC